jgi:VanZ family protein
MKPSLRKALLIALAVGTLAFVAWVILSADGPGLPAFITALYNYPNGDKVGHFLLMGSLAFVLALALPKHWQFPGLGILAVLLAAEEFSQRFIRGRHSSIADLACSLAGVILLGGLAVWLTRRKSPKPS